MRQLLYVQTAVLFFNTPYTKKSFLILLVKEREKEIKKI